MKRCLQKITLKVSKCIKHWIRPYDPRFAISKFREEKKYSIKLENKGCGNLDCSVSGNGITLGYLILDYLTLYFTCVGLITLLKTDGLKIGRWSLLINAASNGFRTLFCFDGGVVWEGRIVKVVQEDWLSVEWAQSSSLSSSWMSSRPDVCCAPSSPDGSLRIGDISCLSCIELYILVGRTWCISFRSNASEILFLQSSWILLSQWVASMLINLHKPKFRKMISMIKDNLVLVIN